MSGMRLQLLGGFALERGGSPVALSPGMERLVSLLAVRGPAQRCVVASTLWPEVLDTHALASLRTCIWRLHRQAPSLVRAEGLLLAVPDVVSVDSREQVEFATRLMRGGLDHAPWLDAWIAPLRRGELLPGWYDDWVVLERERLTQLRLHALELAAGILTRRRQFGAALEFALEAVRTEPLRETANAALMSVYLAEGNSCDAVTHYDAFRELLERELGLEPSPELRRMLPTVRRRWSTPLAAGR